MVQVTEPLDSKAGCVILSLPPGASPSPLGQFPGQLPRFAFLAGSPGPPFVLL